MYPPFTQFLLPLPLTALAVFVALVQTLVFTLLSMIYISEVSHASHDEHGHDDAHLGEAIAVGAADVVGSAAASAATSH